MSAGKKLAGGCAVVVAVPVLWFVWSVFSFFQGMEAGPQPDVVKAAQSATAQSADQAVSTQVDDQIGHLRAALPWASYLGTAVADVCSTGMKPEGAIGAKQSWLPVTCTRTATLYEAFDGDFKQRLPQLDGILGTAGWLPSGLTPGLPVQYRQQESGLAAMFAHMHDPGQDPSPADIARAAAEPNVADLRYTVPITADYPSAQPEYGRNPTGGEVDVTQAPHLPSLDGGQSGHDIMLKYPSVQTSYYRAWQPYSLEQVGKAAYPAHGAVIAIAVSVTYGTGG